MAISRMRATTALVLLLLVLAGCTDSTSPSVPTSPTTEPALPPVVLTTSGGFTGIQQTASVQPDGSWISRDNHGGRRTGKLSGPERVRLRTLASDPRLADEARRTHAPNPCRDAFTYRLIVGTRQIDFTDCPTAPDRPEAALAIVELLHEVTG